MDINTLALLTSLEREIKLKLNLDLCIAGGAVRDLVHSKPFKDVDLEVLNHGIDNDMLISDWVCDVYNNLISIGADNILLNSSSCEDLVDSELLVVIKFTYRGTDFDLLVQSSDPKTPEEAVSVYDMTINQYSLYNGEVKNHAGFNKGDDVKPTGNTFSKDRFYRIRSKYPEYNFDAVEPFVV